MAADDEVIAEIHQALIPVHALGRLLATIEHARIQLEAKPVGPLGQPMVQLALARGVLSRIFDAMDAYTAAVAKTPPTE